jgi:hypothetical protein
MKRSVRVVACLLFLSVLATVPSVMAQADKLIGVWKVTEVKYPQTGDRDAQTITDPQPRLWIFTKKHYSMMEDRSYKPRPDLPENPTDAQRAEAYGPFFANSGTYEVTGSTITLLPIVAMSPNVTNSPRPSSHDFKYEGDSLIILYGTSFGLIELELTRLE